MGFIAVLALVAACSLSDQPKGRLGESITAGDYQLTVTSMENPAERPDRFTNPKPGDRFVKLEVTVTNLGQQHLPVFASHFTLRDTGGIDNAVRTDVSGDRILRQTSVSPGGAGVRPSRCGVAHPDHRRPASPALRGAVTTAQALVA